MGVTPAWAISCAGPIPDNNNICGELKVPAHRRTSRSQSAVCNFPLCRNSTPTARPLLTTIRVTNYPRQYLKILASHRRYQIRARGT